ncbi:MAG: hypothetical protein EPN70_04055 [Paraburkholderia sp.]|uniref:hypothetical protein n=1 Tax=Paraburkholderia sp. TaxID=1926495 RepID=UPI0012078ECE|nr:hypothetical protein [Paraburkholderia sp.]TAM07010.1 MAG: hypothetical protein EPN70_04055 [Paraburkholderia sp.]
MKIILATRQALGLVCYLSVRVAGFFLWTTIAAGAGWMLVHLPDVWQTHIENQSGTSFAIAAITSYAVVTGVLFLVFFCGAVQILADVITEILLFARKRRSQRASSTIQSRQLLHIRKVRRGPPCTASPARGTGESIPPSAASAVLGRQRNAQADAASVSARTDSRSA